MLASAGAARAASIAVPGVVLRAFHIENSGSPPLAAASVAHATHSSAPVSCTPPAKKRAAPAAPAAPAKKGERDDDALSQA